MPSIINQGLNSATTEDWLNATKNMKLTAFDPCSRDLRATFMIAPPDVEQEHNVAPSVEGANEALPRTAYVIGKVTTEQTRTDVVAEPANHSETIAVGRLRVKARAVSAEAATSGKTKMRAKKTARPVWKAKKRV